MRWNESEQVNLSLKDCLNSTFESRIRWCMIKPQILQSGRHYWSKITLTSQRGEVLWNLPCKRKKRGGGEGEIKLKKALPVKHCFALLPQIFMIYFWLGNSLKLTSWNDVLTSSSADEQIFASRIRLHLVPPPQLTVEKWIIPSFWSLCILSNATLGTTSIGSLK